MRVRPSLLGLHHLALNARDLPVMKRFYVEVLGFRVEWEPDAENVYLTSGSDNLALHQAPASDVGGRGSAGSPRAPQRGCHAGDPATRELVEGRTSDGATREVLDHFGLVVPARADVDAWAAYLEDCGVALDGPPRTHRDGARSLYIRDPENNRVQIIYHPPISDRPC